MIKNLVLFELKHGQEIDLDDLREPLGQRRLLKLGLVRVKEGGADLGVAVGVDDLPEDVVVHRVGERRRHDEAAHRNATTLGDVDELFSVRKRIKN